MKPTRKQIADAFRYCQKVIALPDTHIDWRPYICHALDDYAWLAGPDKPAIAEAAKEIIRVRMGVDRVVAKSFGLEEWLHKHGHITGSQRRKLWAGHPTMREYRLRWLDALIKEFDS